MVQWKLQLLYLTLSYYCEASILSGLSGLKHLTAITKGCPSARWKDKRSVETLWNQYENHASLAILGVKNFEPGPCLLGIAHPETSETLWLTTSCLFIFAIEICIFLAPAMFWNKPMYVIASANLSWLEKCPTYRNVYVDCFPLFSHQKNGYQWWIWPIMVEIHRNLSKPIVQYLLNYYSNWMVALNEMAIHDKSIASPSHHLASGI